MLTSPQSAAHNTSTAVSVECLLL